jgi:hypothetical protein
MELEMQDLTALSQTLGGLPAWALMALVVLSAFALAAFAIHAVLTVTKGRN